MRWTVVQNSSPPAAQAAPSRCLTNTPIAIVIEDEPQIRRFVRGALEAEGWQVHEADTVQRGLTEAGTRKPDLLVLDLGLPDGDGIQLIRDVRGWSGVPIIVLSARVDEADKIAALDAGADDYLTKPFGMGELLARVRANLRRPRAATADGAAYEADPVFRFGECRGGPSLPAWYGATARRCISRRSNTGCSRCLSPTRGECSPIASCCAKSGALPTRSRATTCASTWGTCGKSWKPTLPSLGIC